MILEAIVNLLCLVVTSLVTVLPSGAAWAPDFSPVAAFFGNVWALNTYLPVSEAFQLLGFSLTIMGARYVFSAAMWIYNRVRG